LRRKTVSPRLSVCINGFGISQSLKPEKGKYYNIIYIVAIIFSALATVEIVIGVIDIAFALMAIPNMIAILYLGKHITKEMRERAWI